MLGRTSISWRFCVPRGQRVDLDEIAAYRLRERLEVGDGRHDADLLAAAALGAWRLTASATRG